MRPSDRKAAPSSVCARARSSTSRSASRTALPPSSRRPPPRGARPRSRRPSASGGEFGNEVARRWREPDEGIWEIRDIPRHFTHSRVLCWAALNRLVQLHAKGPGAEGAPRAAGGARVSWPGSLLAGFVGTLVLPSLEAGAQQLHLTCMSLPYLLGAMFTPSRDRAKVIGFFTHLVNGQIVALLYVAIFHAVGASGVLRGALMGIAHSAIVLLVVVPLLPVIHPRMATLHQGPTDLRRIEPPGPLGLYYGVTTPLMVLLAHVAFGAVGGGLYRFR